ncbi:phosphatase PAP2 family protein [Streptomyces sp. NPDC086080]|uniref:phosphatase PAP2 family protein n=1 Tax=Streptomyces sp. NPDC086080 TaxID=3365748 RepID=UPI0037D84F4D
MVEELTRVSRGERSAGRPGRAVLPPALRAWLGTVAVLAALVTGALGVVYAGGGEPGGVDAWVPVGSSGRDAALAVDFLGEPVGAAVLVLVAVTGCLLGRWARAAVLVVAGTGLAVGITKLLKPLVGRTIHGDANLSYPSGHTAFLTAFALVGALVVTGRLGLGRTAGLSLVLAAALVAGGAMGWAQVTLGAHYPTDVLGGWCTALAVIPVTAWAVDAGWRRRL